MSKIWLMTGTSQGFGRGFVKVALDSRDRAVASTYLPEQLDELYAAVW